MYTLYIETIRKRQHLANSLITKPAEANSLSFPVKSESFGVHIQCPVFMVVNSKVYLDIILFLLKKPHSFNTAYEKYPAVQ